MSSNEIIVKRRPSRPQELSEAPTAEEVMAEAQRYQEAAAEPYPSALLHDAPAVEEEEAADHHQHDHHAHQHYNEEEAAEECDDAASANDYEEEQEEEEAHEHHGNYEAEPEAAVQPRQTCPFPTTAPHAHAEAAIDLDGIDTEDDDDAGEAPAAAEEEAAEDAAIAVAPPPPAAMKTARPATATTKKAKAHRAKSAKTPAKETTPAPAARAAAAKKKKKPTRKVSLANVEKQPPVAEGVNTPRSLAVCEKYGVNPMELAPYPKDHFHGPGVEDEVAELRYHSYEKRRQARMAELMPAYRAMPKPSRPPAKAKAAKAAASEAQEEEAEESQRPTKEPTDEEEAMQRQFEEQHQRLLEQERRKASGGTYDSDGRRRSSVRGSHPRGTSPRAGAGQTSPSRYSVSSATQGRPTVDQPYSAVKIYSHSIAQERPLTQSEAVMIEDINEREARRLDTQERAAIIQENKQLMYVERELEKQRRASETVHTKASERERLQQEHFKHSKDRYYEAFARRERLEEERQAKLRESLAEKEGQVHANDPYASLLSRRRQSSTATRRASSNTAPQSEEPSQAS